MQCVPVSLARVRLLGGNESAGAGEAVAAESGNVVQTVHTHYKDRVTDTSGGWVPIDNTGFVVSLTPRAAGSRIVVTARVHIGASEDQVGHFLGLRLYRRVGGTGAAWANVAAASGTDSGVDPIGTGCFMAHTQVYIPGPNYDTHVANVCGVYVDTAVSGAPHAYTLYWKSKLESDTAGVLKYLNRPHICTSPAAMLTTSSLTAEEVI